jgi:hypothetical protein
MENGVAGKNRFFSLSTHDFSLLCFLFCPSNFFTRLDSHDKSSSKTEFVSSQNAFSQPFDKEKWGLL